MPPGFLPGGFADKHPSVFAFGKDISPQGGHYLKKENNLGRIY